MRGERVASDGSFSLAAIKPDNSARLWVFGDSGKFSIDRAERDGAPIGKVTNLGTITSLGGLNPTPCENITGLRIFVTYSDGAIRDR